MDIFISYAREDAVFAARLHEGISSCDLSVWRDSEINAGERYTDEIDSALNTATIVVVVVSPASNESEWVRREILYAQQLDKRIVPVLASEISLPLLLADLHAISLYENFETGLNQLVTTLDDTKSLVIATLASSGRGRPTDMTKVLWLFLAAVGLVVLTVITVRSDGLIAEITATGLAIGGALLMMAWKADDAISIQFKRDLGLWLDGLDPSTMGRTLQRWPIHFAALFDRVFGKKHLSWRCFFRSSLASLLAFLLCTLIFVQASPGEWLVYIEKGGLEPFISLAIVAMVANLLPDYVSLLETRWVIMRMQDAFTFTRLFGWLLVDLVATTAIFFLFLIGLQLITMNKVDLDFMENLVLWSLLIPADEPQWRIYAIPVWTTYFTTAWTWLYFFAQFLMRFIKPMRRLVTFLKYALPVEQRPLRTIGQIMALLATISYCLLMLPLSSIGGGQVVPDMIILEPGQFTMGDLNGEGDEYEVPRHEVSISKRFAIGKYEVTFQEYDRFAEDTGRILPNDEGWGRGRRPVINIGWDDAKAYTQWLSEQTGKHYRLPTEAEWEYAARANTQTLYWWGDDVKQNGKVWANCAECGSEWDNLQTAPVGQFPANPFGLHDMAGNVMEFVEDCWHDNYEGAPTDGSAWVEEGSSYCGMPVYRGGFWKSNSGDLRHAYRRPVFGQSSGISAMGFRLAQDL